ncbi:hypothetical protein KAR91_09455 [Candidatus Pacearchaeota archaeon]|nr:hypothetical protein [Candidatus Pacearchaeota archaeon]
MKYIVYRDNGEEFMITFPGGGSQPRHKGIAEALGLKDIVSAGFFMEIIGRKRFFGESKSLGVKSRGDIDRDLYLNQAMR